MINLENNYPRLGGGFLFDFLVEMNCVKNSSTANLEFILQCN
ncbi:hypothetical protein SynRS9915_00570 [Synechococcus sp. RS9915]|nr:hypothetical protein SynRS9915_00570 [Synechococcus sp. RS9915]